MVEKTWLVMARLLICSDDTLLAELVRSVVADLGVEVRVALDCTEFERMTQTALYDLLLVIGVRLFRGGTAWVERVRPRPLQHPEIFVLAWQQSEHTVLSLLEAGTNQYMTFPFNPVRLRAKIIESLGLQ